MTDSPTTITLPRLLTVRECAEVLRLSGRQIHNLLSAGELTRIRIGPGSTRIDARQVADLIERRKAP